MSDGRFENPPIDRHPALAPLSRDHYAGLVVAQRLIRAADDDAAARRSAVSTFIEAWEREIAIHFADEERLLPPHMSEEDWQRMQREHASLRRLADEAAAQIEGDGAPPSTWLRSVGEALRDHIRWEERGAFQRIEAGAGEDALEELAQVTEKIEQSRPRQACGSRREAPDDEAAS